MNDFVVVLVVWIIVSAFYYFIGMQTLAPWIGFVAGAVAWGILAWRKHYASSEEIELPDDNGSPMSQ